MARGQEDASMGLEAALIDDVASAERSVRRRRGILAHANVGTLFGGIILLLVLICVAVPRVVAPGDPNALDLAARLLGPGAPGHVLGTDALGHDVYRLIVAGARLSILVAVAAVVISCAIGVTLGLVSGYYGGVVDAVIMRWTDIQLSFPFILLAILILTLFGGGIVNLILVLAIGGLIDYPPLLRMQA